MSGEELWDLTWLSLPSRFFALVYPSDGGEATVRSCADSFEGAAFSTFLGSCIAFCLATASLGSGDFYTFAFAGEDTGSFGFSATFGAGDLDFSATALGFSVSLEAGFSSGDLDLSATRGFDLLLY